VKITYHTDITRNDRLRCAAMIKYDKEDASSIMSNLEGISVTAYCTISQKTKFIVGFAILHPLPELGKCGMTFYVRPNKRNMNIGHELAKIALHQMKEMELQPCIACLHPASKIILAKLGLECTFNGEIAGKPVYTMGYKKPVS